jgi:hypothetical protein
MPSFCWWIIKLAGVQLTSWFGIAGELHRNWRNGVEGLA